MLRFAQLKNKTLWLELDGHFLYKGSTNYCLNLNIYSSKQILPDYYQEFLYNNHNFFTENVNPLNTSECEFERLLNDFLEFYEKQILIFKLLNIKPILDLEEYKC